MNVTSIHAFAEKVALISDITDPVGRAAALQLALQGAFVVGGLPDGKTDDGGIAELVSLGTLASAVEYRPASVSGTEALADAARQAFGRLDLLINCLKFEAESAFSHDNERRFEAEMSDNVRQVYYLTNACFELMKDRPKPKIVNVVRNIAGPENALLRASQEAIISLNASFAAEFPANFRINAVSVGDQAPASDDAARMIMFLLSSEAVAVNGRTIDLK